MLFVCYPVKRSHETAPYPDVAERSPSRPAGIIRKPMQQTARSKRNLAAGRLLRSQSGCGFQPWQAHHAQPAPHQRCGNDDGLYERHSRNSTDRQLTLQDSGRIFMTLVTVGSGNPEKDTLTFQQEGRKPPLYRQRLWYGRAYAGEKRKPAPGNKELIVWMKGEEECDRGPGFSKTKCYQVQYGDKMMVPANEPWNKLMEPIEGFTFEKGISTSSK